MRKWDIRQKYPIGRFLVPFASAEFCAHSHFYPIYAAKRCDSVAADIQTPRKFRIREWSNEIFHIRCQFTFTQ